MIDAKRSKQFSINFILIFSFVFLLIISMFSSPVFAQKVLQCAPLKAMVNNDLEVKNDLQVDHNAVIANDATVNNDLRVNKDIYGASGAQRIWLGNNTSSPYITNNAGDGILFYSQGGQNFLWQSLTNPNPDAMILRSGGGLPNNNDYNLQVFGQVSSYQLHTQVIHLDSQGIGSGLNSNIIRLTNTAGAGNGAGIFIGNGNDDLLFSTIQVDSSPGTTMLALDTSNNNVGIQTVNPQIALAIGDNDTGLKWISDGNFQLFSNGSYEIDVTPGNVGIRNNLSIGNEFCLGGVCKSAWPPAVPETDPFWTAASANYYTKTNLQTSGQASTHWGNLTNVPADIADGDQVGITSVPNCGANQKLTGSAGSPVCANDIDTDTQDLSIAGNVISLTDGGAITLPLAAVDTLDTVTANGNTTGNSISVGGLTSTGNATLGDAVTDLTTVNGDICIGFLCIKNIASKRIYCDSAGSCDDQPDLPGCHGSVGTMPNTVHLSKGVKASITDYYCKWKGGAITGYDDCEGGGSDESYSDYECRYIEVQ